MFVVYCSQIKKSPADAWGRIWSVIMTYTHEHTSRHDKTKQLSNDIKITTSTFPLLFCLISFRTSPAQIITNPLTSSRPSDHCVCCTTNGAHPFGYELFMHNWSTELWDVTRLKVDIWWILSNGRDCVQK